MADKLSSAPQLPHSVDSATLRTHGASSAEGMAEHRATTVWGMEKSIREIREDHEHDAFPDHCSSSRRRDL